MEGCGGKLKPCRMSVSGQLLQWRAPNLHTRPKSQSASKAIGLTAHVIETAKPRRPRALTRVAVEENGGGFGSLKKKGKKEREFGISFVRLLMSVTYTNLFLLSIWRLDPQ